jgi:hypothetical protein
VRFRVFAVSALTIVAVSILTLALVSCSSPKSSPGGPGQKTARTWPSSVACRSWRKRTRIRRLQPPRGEYDALLLVGGSGPMIDMVNNERLHDVIMGLVAKDKLVAAECYCVTCLAFARDWTDRKSIVAGKHITGHAREYDYKDGTGFAHPSVAGANFGPPFYPLEYILRDAVGPDGQFHGGVGHTRSTILDYPFLTGRSTQDAQLVGKLMITVLENGLRRHGW